MAEVIKDYELCALFRPDLDAEVLDNEVAAIQKLIEDRGGEMSRVDRWNRRFLAYPIKEYREGFYVIYRWFSTTELLQDLQYHLRYDDNLLRYLVLDYTEKERKRRKRLGKVQTS
ncbi:MAG: 30S ribosomal protein S6 [Planctomycetales bacterium]|nr:30S ribosomal protein S6 [bacterium]UNM08738.1 MAG: 30S ribosomal protein S6 [Planctomycetales bacterium]